MDLLRVLARCEAEAKRGAPVSGVVTAGLVTSALSGSTVERMRTAEAAVALEVSVRRVQQLVRSRVLSSPGRGFVLRAEVEALLQRRMRRS